MKAVQQISDSEKEIMQIIWHHKGRILFAPLCTALEAQKRLWKANTVLTFLTRLADKGFIRIEKKGRLNEYIALSTEDEYLESLTLSFVDTVFGGDAKSLVASLLSQDRLTQEDMEELKAFWNGGKDIK